MRGIEISKKWLLVGLAVVAAVVVTVTLLLIKWFPNRTDTENPLPISSAETVTEEKVIDAGVNILTIAQDLEQRGLMSSEEFLRGATNEKLLKQLEIQAPSIEGIVIPGSFRVVKGRAFIYLLLDIVNHRRRVITPRYLEKVPYGISFDDAVVVASIATVEKQGGADPVSVVDLGIRALRNEGSFESIAVDRYFEKLAKSNLAAASRIAVKRDSGLPMYPISTPDLEMIDMVLQRFAESQPARQN